ncbi:hypothetical protein AB0L88_16080 [Saccharopolyspora shandongensis]|uniref:hypothetical protein n=1 Tax=Saccharopolyspora shandongensis TaxID=418495 RepID=UPI003414F3A7
MLVPDWELLSWIAAVFGLPVATWLGLRQLKVSNAVSVLAALVVLLGVLVVGYAFPRSTQPGGQDQGQGSNENPPQPQPIDQPSKPENTGPRCAVGYRETPHAPVELKPCISRTGNQLEISTEVVSTAAGEVTVWLWLYDAKAEYRSENLLHRCSLAFNAAQQTQRCVFSATPDRPGLYDVATHAELTSQADDVPRAWGEPLVEFTGTQSGYPMAWPPQ